jgi:hypothetical protein
MFQCKCLGLKHPLQTDMTYPRSAPLQEDHTSAERVNVVLGIYKHYPGSLSSLIQYPGYTSLSRTLPSIVIRYLHSRLSRAWLWSRDRLKENGGDGVLFLVTTDILGNVYIPRTTFTLSGTLAGVIQGA